MSADVSAWPIWPLPFASMRDAKAAAKPRPGRGLGVWLLLAAALLMSGCAAVSVSSVSPALYLAERRGDVLTTGHLSGAAQEVARVAGIDDCGEAPDSCRQALAQAEGITDEQRLSALAELWLQAALEADRPPAVAPEAPDAQPAGQGGDADATAVDAWLETARHAWAYLFLTRRSPGDRAFEDRQTQVRDYYNFAVQRTVTRLFHRYARDARAPGAGPSTGDAVELAVGRWQLAARLESPSFAGDMPLPQELLPASSLRFTGLRNTYRRDGFGAPLVAVLPPAQGDPVDAPFTTMRYPAITALLTFEGRTLAEVLGSHRVQVRLYDPYRSDRVDLAGVPAPLAANFTAGYGLWLARSGFAKQALRTLLGLSDGIVQPQVQLMQPYDPERGIVVMLHGLASSPEAWVNVANEVLGDETLRQHYQIWQVYYPTNAPLVLNRRNIALALQQTLAHFDPQGTAPASRHMVLVGHSMGGVLARLLVSDPGRALWSVLPQGPAMAAALADDPTLQRELGDYLDFKPLPQVDRAVFIAAPHRGTPFAETGLARRVANLVTLPLAMLEQVNDLSRRLARLPPMQENGLPLRLPNSIDNLSDRDPFVRAVADLPISPKVRYHSIIGREDPAQPLARSSDGVVPYASAHLDGAESERVITSWHSVQETPQAMLEVRRILREQLRSEGAAR